LRKSLGLHSNWLGSQLAPPKVELCDVNPVRGKRFRDHSTGRVFKKKLGKSEAQHASEFIAERVNYSEPNVQTC
jgi:hypothetical protein